MTNETSYNFFVDVNVYYPSFECGYYLPQSLNMLSESLSLPTADKCIGVENISVFCDNNNFDNSSQVSKENSSALLGTI